MTIGWSLACSGLEIPGIAPEVPADPLVAELLAAEPGEDAAPGDDAATSRTEALTAFLAATPDFAEWKVATLDCLAAECAPVTEAAYAKVRAEYEAKPPVVATKLGDEWKVLVIVDHAYDGAEDWAASSTEMEDALPADLISTVRAGLGVYGVSVTADGAETALLDLKEFVSDHEPKIGYVAARDNGEPLWIEHGPVAEVTAAACAYFEIDCAAEDDEEAADPDEEGATRTRPPGTRAKVKARMKAKAGN